MISATLGSRRLMVRFAALVALLLATAIVLWVGGKLSGLPAGYGNTQNDSASQLLQRSAGEWSTLRRGSAKDLLIFIPIYVLWGLGVTALIRATPRRTWQGWARVVLSPVTLAGAVIALAVADVTETVLFRASLTRLIDTNGGAEIDGLTDATQAFFWLKFAAAPTALGLLAVQVLAPPRRTNA